MDYIEEKYQATKQKESIYSFINDALNIIVRDENGKYKHIDHRIKEVKKIINNIQAEIEYFNKLSKDRQISKSWKMNFGKSLLVSFLFGIIGSSIYEFRDKEHDVEKYRKDLNKSLEKSKETLKILEEKKKKLSIKEAAINKTNKELFEIQKIFTNIIVNGEPTYSDLNNLTKYLNKFLPEAKCSQVLYTDNKDNLFFGMCVYPNIRDDRLREVYSSKDKIKNDSIYGYILELDSRLFNMDIIGLTAAELTAILLHEIGHIIINKKSLEDINQMSQMIQADNPDYNIYDKFHRCTDFFRYALYLTLRRMNSVFEKNAEEYIADGIVVEYGYGNELSSAFKKIIKQRKALVQDTNNRGIAILWAYKVSTNMESRRVSLQYQINEIEKASGSKTEQNILKKLRQIARTKGFVHESYTLDDNMLLEMRMFKNMKKKALYSLEDDLYEYNIRLKNLESEIEALDLIRNINYKINILKEYINIHGKEDYEIDRWRELLNKYLHLREQLMKTQIYRDKYYGLFVEMPKVRGRYQL